MSSRTVDWAAGGPRDPAPDSEGLRQRKKRLLRQQLSDTATEMFLERGFDAVRVTDIAEACGVSEKTVYNYFPNKESLLLDRWDSTMTSLRTGLADPDIAAVDAARRVLADELDAVTGWLGSRPDPAAAGARIQRFGALLHATPALRAHQHDATDQLVDVATATLRERAGMAADAPEPRIAAIALLGLWDIQFRSLNEHLGAGHGPDRIRRDVTADVERAARLLEAGLGSLTRWSRPRS